MTLHCIFDVHSRSLMLFLASSLQELIRKVIHAQRMRCNICRDKRRLADALAVSYRHYISTSLAKLSMSVQAKYWMSRLNEQFTIVGELSAIRG